MLGIALFKMNRFDESIDRFKELLSEQDSLPDEWVFWDARVYYYSLKDLPKKKSL